MSLNRLHSYLLMARIIQVKKKKKRKRKKKRGFCFYNGRQGQQRKRLSPESTLSTFTRISVCISMCCLIFFVLANGFDPV